MIKKCLLVCACAIACQACTQVKVWERGNLAKAEMAFTPDSLEAQMRGHVYHSKEASQSAAAGAGGGCGCN